MENQKVDNVKAQTRVRPESMEKVDYYAAKLGITRGKLIRNMIESSLDDLRLFELLGILKAIQIGGIAKHKLVETYLEGDPLEAFKV